MTRTSNYDLIVVEGNDKVNLLTQMNPNTEKIDEVMKTNEKSGVQVATELLSGTVHAITRTVKSASMFKFTAVSNYTSGDTFTVDGLQVTALLTSGEALGTGAYIIGSEVLCSLKDTLLTVYTQGGTVKLAEDSEKLGGNLPDYYAKQSDLSIVKSTADSASSLSRQNTDKLNKLNERIGCSYNGINLIYRQNNDINEGLYTVEYDGFIQGIAKTASKIGNPFIRLEINNTLVFEGVGLNKIYSYLWSPLFEVRKGDIIKYTLTSETNDATKELRLYKHRP